MDNRQPDGRPDLEAQTRAAVEGWPQLAEFYITLRNAGKKRSMKRLREWLCDEIGDWLAARGHVSDATRYVVRGDSGFMVEFTNPLGRRRKDVALADMATLLRREGSMAAFTIHGRGCWEYQIDRLETIHLLRLCRLLAESGE